MKEAAERTVEDESGLEGVLLPIHLASDDAEEGLGIDHDLDPVLLDDLVKLFGLVDVFEMVTHAGATLVADADPDEFRLWLIEQALDAFDGSFALFERGQSVHHDAKGNGCKRGLTRVSAALRGRAAVRALGLGLAAAAEGVAGGIGTGCTAGVGVWSRIGARAVEADERKRGEGRWRSAAAHPGHEGVGGYARRDEVDLSTVRSMLVDARRDMTVWARVRFGAAR